MLSYIQIYVHFKKIEIELTMHFKTMVRVRLQLGIYYLQDVSQWKNNGSIITYKQLMN